MVSLTTRGTPFPAVIVALLTAWTAFLAVGCGSETGNPIRLETMGSTPPKEESLAMDLDARGVVGGFFIPGDDPVGLPTYPIRYSKDWTVFRSNKTTSWYMAKSATPKARLDIVGTHSRVIIDFWDYDQYASPGTVIFYQDDRQLGRFDLDRNETATTKTVDYQIVTGKTTVSTVTMILESGRAVVTGFRLIFPQRTTP